MGKSAELNAHRHAGCELDWCIIGHSKHTSFDICRLNLMLLIILLPIIIIKVQLIPMLQTFIGNCHLYRMSKVTNEGNLQVQIHQSNDSS